MRHERSGGLTRLYEWALPNLHQPLTVDQLAQQAGLSQRTVIRRFNADTGQPPMRWLLEARLSHARELLESTDLTVEGVARRSGLGTPAGRDDHPAGRPHAKRNDPVTATRPYLHLEDLRDSPDSSTLPS